MILLEQNAFYNNFIFFIAFLCMFLYRSWQYLTFDARPVVFVRIVGVDNTANEVCIIIVE